MKLTARARLALLQTALVLTTGAALTGLTYLLMKRRPALVTHLDPTGPDPQGTLQLVPPQTQDLHDLADRVQADTLAALLPQAGLALIMVTALAAVLAWLVAGRVLRPIRVISAAARRSSAENLTERVPVTTPADELSTLAGTVNDMLDRIQRGIAERDRILDSQRLFTANAAHELRTPLTTARTAIDVTLDGDPSHAELRAMAGDVRNAVEHMQRVLNGLLLLARSQAGLTAREPADLATLAASTLDTAQARAAAADVTVQPRLRPAPVNGEPVLLERMIGNLVDNAIRYNQTGGHLTVDTDTAGGRAVLRISNTGRKIPPGEAQTLLEPFVHGQGIRSRTDGLGLGLTIVRAITLAHRGHMVVTAHTGGGLDITIDLPHNSSDGRAVGTMTRLRSPLTPGVHHALGKPGSRPPE
ncbi:cell wall metabolism sensor histidine kinase WalK [Nonomuraea sp. NEAU-A123]|uniref:sensor histidine kinase n=1 Tax=Nonomuraea sp. NEAU-A123 TaxID=2839649 RepID=UPI001BE4B57F|nr:HAMP domain-containing sensor histidine kinase [Nonomuraea sp. NEAU-A123]MBT2227764.1 HAMP domain-containing histidine kinase [Nonomuraea sp. NEAU-A123]